MNRDEKLISEAYLETLNEGWKDKLAALGLAGAVAGGAAMKDKNSNLGAQQQPGIVQQAAASSKTSPAVTNLSKLKADLMKKAELFEERRSKVYPDPIHGMKVPTVGIGFNLNRNDADQLLKDVGLTKQQVLNGYELNDKQIDYLLSKTMDGALQDVRKLVPNFDQLPYIVQKVLGDMSFNLGGPKLAKFEDMLEAISKNDFYTASKELQDSLYFKQTGQRARQNYLDMKSAGIKGGQKGSITDFIADVSTGALGRPAGSFNHVVQQGENLTRIARQYGTSVKQIKQDNFLRSDLIRPGQKLTIKR